MTTSQLSPEQIADRRTGITATDIAAILGVHPYRSAVDVWQAKRTGDTFEGNDRTKWGQILEPVIRADYEERHGVHVELRGTLTHPSLEWMKATPDGLVFQPAAVDADRGLEIKCHTVYLAHMYGAPGSDEVPPYELCQCMWGMGVTGLPRWDLVAFIDGMPNEYAIDRDDELIGVMIERAERFRVDNVLGGEPPPPDGSDAYSKWLAAVHKADNAEAELLVIAPDDAPLMAVVARLRELRDEIAELEKAEGLQVQTLKGVIGNHAGIAWPNGKPGPTKGKNKGVLPMDKITWKKAKDGVVRTYAATFEAMRAKAGLLASAKEADVRRAITALNSMAEATFENSRATCTALEVRTLLADMYKLVNEIATTEAGSVPTTGSRRFCVPKHWKAKKDSDSADSE